MSESTTPPAALLRVRKLLALASSPNPHEAAVAAAHAQALIEAHRLQRWIEAEAEVMAEPFVDARDAPLLSARRLRKWKVALAMMLAEANDCVAYTMAGPSEQAIGLMGRAPDIEAVRALYEGLLPRIEWLSATHGEGRPHAWHEAFRIGVVDAIAERLSAATTEVHEALDSAALVRVDPTRAAHREALDRFAESRLGRGRSRGIRVDARAWRRGRAAAAEVKLP